MSAITLDELEKLQKSIQPKTKTSPTPLTAQQLSVNPGVALIKIPKKFKTVLEEVEEEHGGRDALISILAESPLDKKQQHFLDLLCDPKRIKDSVSTIARDAGLSPSQAVTLLRTSAAAKSLARGLSKLSNSIPAVVEDLTSKAVDSKIECPECFGSGNGLDGLCMRCSGKGMVMQYSDLDRQKIVLESVGIIKKGTSGVNLQIQQNVGISAGGSFFSKYVKSSDEAAYAIDAEVLKDDGT